MTHKPPQRPGRLSMPWVTSARGTSDGRVGQAPVRARLVSLLLRPTAPPLALGVVAAAFLLSFQTPEFQTLLSIRDYMDFVATLFLAFGVLMEFPILLVGLSRVGIVTSERLRRAL